MSTVADGERVFDLRPLNLADLLDAVIRIYRARFRQLIGIAAVITLPLGVLQVASTVSMFSGVMDDPQGVPNMSMMGLSGLGLYGLLFWLTMPLMQAAFNATASAGA